MLKKKLLIGVLALAFVLVVGVSTADAYSTLRLGSKGADVVTLQTKLGGLTADGSFGNLTLAAVKAFQTNKGLTADGVVGPMTWAALMSGTTTTTGNLPAGCTSTVGYSSLTGAKCDGSTTGSTTTGPLVGDAGDITLTATSTDVEDYVVEGNTDKVLGFKVEADGSDVLVKNLKLTFENEDLDGSYRLSDYAEKVNVYMGSTKVGSVDVADFSKDGHVYSKSVSLTDAIVREGSSKKATFYVEVEAVSNVDGDDIGDNDWNVMVDNIRFQDATGVIMTNSDSVDTNFYFTDLSGSGDVELTVSKGSNNPEEGNVEVSTTGSTSNVLMLEFKLKAEGSEASFDELDVDAEVNEADDSILGDIVGELVLKSGSDELASISMEDTDTEGVYKFELDDTFTVDADSTETFKVYAKINDADNFDAGDALAVSFDAISAEDENGDVIVDTGSAAGEDQYFYAEGISVELNGTPSATKTSAQISGESDVLTATVKVEITAFGDTMYVSTDLADHTWVATDTDVDVTLLEIETNADEVDDGYEIAEGDSEIFEYTLVMETTETTSQAARAYLTGIAWDVASDGLYADIYTSNLDDIKTPAGYSIKALP